MHHYFEAITNTSGDSLVGYFARVIDPGNLNTITLSADDNGTPIVVVSGVENMASTDAYGNIDFYVAPGTYHLDIYAPNATSFIMRVSNVAMSSDKGDPGPQGSPGPQGEGLADVMAPSGSSLVGFQQNGAGAVTRTIQDKQNERRSVLDFMGVSSSVAAAFELAAASSGYQEVHIPVRTYLIDRTIAIPSGVKFVSEGATLAATQNGQTIFDSGNAAYSVKMEGFRITGNGKTGVRGFRLNNFRVFSVIRDVEIVDCDTGWDLVDGCFGLMMDNCTTSRVPNPVKAPQNASSALILNPAFDNGPSIGGTGAGTGVFIGAASNSGIRIIGGYIQGFTYGVEDRGVGTRIETYFETNSQADVYANGARLGRYINCEHLADQGISAYRLRNTDGCKVLQPAMASGARQMLFDVDSFQGFEADWQDSSTSLNTPTGNLTYVARTAAQSYGAFFPIITGSINAGTANYSTQLGSWKKTGNRVDVTIAVDWANHTGTGSITFTGVPSFLTPVSFSLQKFSTDIELNFSVTGRPRIVLNGASANMTLLVRPSGGSDALVPMVATGSIIANISWDI